MIVFGDGRRGLGVFIALMVLVVAPAAGPAAVWNVTDIYSFDAAMRSLSPGDEVVCAPGEYDVTKKHSYYITTPDITIRGATGNREDVIFRGGGMNNTSAIREGFQLVAANQTIRDLTLEGFYHHAIHFQTAATNVHVYNVKTLNIGEQHMKGARYNYGGLVEYSWMEQTETRLNGMPDRPDEYVGGIDLHGAVGWTIRDNLVSNTVGALRDGDAGIFLWNDSKDSVIERNVVINVNKGIALGNPSSTEPVSRVIVRNNFVVQYPDNDIGIEVDHTVDCKILNNTIYHTAPGGSNWHRVLQVYGAESGLVVAGNIIRGNVKDSVAGDWSNAAVRAMGNIVDSSGTLVMPDWFVDPLAGDLHLTANATAAIDQAAGLADVLEDIDTGFRPLLPDLGADEYRNPIPGDANRDGAVNVFDLAALAVHYATTGPQAWVDGDFNMDRTVNVFDLAALASNYGVGTTGGSASVPEPAAMTLLLVAAAFLPRRRR